MRWLAFASMATLALAAPRRADAQACCAGASVLTPARLSPAEDALVGVHVRATDVFGSFDPQRRFIPASAGSVDLGLEQDIVGALRVSKGQVSASLPLVETYRRVPGAAEAGGGVGDLQIGGRYDFTLAGESPVIPGVALALTVSLPTGRATEWAEKPLATDATGTGALGGSLSLSLEQIFSRRLFVGLGGSAAFRAGRTVGDVDAQQGAQFIGYATGGYVFSSGAILALTASYAAELDAVINGARAPDSGRAATRLGLAGGVSLSDVWRMQGTLFGDVPVRPFGLNQPLGAGFTFMLMRSWI